MHVVLRKSTAETQTDHKTEQNKKEIVEVEGMKKCSAEKENIAP